LTGLVSRRTIGGAGRRVIDLIVVLALAPVVVPLLLFLAALIRLDSPGPIFVSHARLGQGAVPFRLYKLRTMTRDADARKAELAHLNVLAWPDFKIPNDPRITRVGRVLRKTSLDELPQLWNVARGELTLVGPRACSVTLQSYALWQTERLEARPGLFGRWQAEARGRATFDERCRMDIAELRTRTIGSQLRVAVKTLRSVITGSGAS
jgi:lipopolysaccharide/colanic/teichoic acid biosynthesis glycosyltransferase